jgi:hypothetical protein
MWSIFTIYIPSQIPPILGLHSFHINFSRLKRKKAFFSSKVFSSDIQGTQNVTGKWREILSILLSSLVGGYECFEEYMNLSCCEYFKSYMDI